MPSTALAVIPPPLTLYTAPKPQAPQPDVVSAFLAGLSPNTRRAYAGDLEDFAAFLNSPTPAAAVESLLGMGPGQANACALAYRNHLTTRNLSSATIGRRMSALKAMVKVARLIGRVTWALDVQAPKGEKYRDTSGPGNAGWRAMLAIAKADAASGATSKGKRDLAIIRLLHDLALRRGEVTSLDLSHLDLETRTLSILGKGRQGRERVTLPEPTCKALAGWLAARGTDPGPLFVRLDRARGSLPGEHGSEAGRLTGEAVRLLVAAIGKRAGLTRIPRPHGLRHQGITSALDRTNGNLRSVGRFSRHRDLRVLSVYDDNRLDLAGDVARLVADE